MRIAQVAPPWLAVPPTGYGGVEWVVALLTDGLVERGHEVTLFATGDSETTAKLEFVFERAPGPKWINTAWQDSVHAMLAFRAKNKIASSLVLQGEVPLGRMRTIGGNWIYNKEYRSLEQDKATLMAVTPASLKDLMRKYTFDPMTIVTLGPAKE